MRSPKVHTQIVLKLPVYQIRQNRPVPPTKVNYTSKQDKGTSLAIAIPIKTRLMTPTLPGYQIGSKIYEGERTLVVC